MPRLKITLHSHLLVAGSRLSGLGVDLATARRYIGSKEVPYIPATALRGAVRLQLEALLQATGRPCTGPYPFDPPEEGEQASRPPEPDDLVARLFGYSGPRGQRDGSQEGQLRFGDAVPADPDLAARALSVRPGLELDDQKGTAKEHHLFFREVAETMGPPLVFHADLDLRKVSPEDEQFLQRAVESTGAIGAGKSKGGGMVTIEWLNEPPSRAPSPGVDHDTGALTRARLLLTAEEPLHLGEGGPMGNYHATRAYVPGSTVRGAVAWALLRAGITTDHAEDFQALFLANTAASFGDALPIGADGAEPAARPATARTRRGSSAIQDDVLVRELARERVNQALAAAGSRLYLRADDGEHRLEPVNTGRSDGDLVRRIRTRVAIDRYRGTASDGRLFSIEQIEPWIAEGPGRSARQVRFVSWVEGLGEAGHAAARLLGRLAEVPLLIGAGRNHGLGRVRVDIGFEPDPDLGDSEVEAEVLARAVEEAVRRFGERVGLQDVLPWPESRVPLALIGTSDFVPSGSERHPLSEPRLSDLDLGPWDLWHSFLLPTAVGGYDQRKGSPPLKDLFPAVGSGSVFVYRVERDQLARRLREVLPRLRRGVGRCVESGCGRFEIFRPMREEPS